MQTKEEKRKAKICDELQKCGYGVVHRQYRTQERCSTVLAAAHCLMRRLKKVRSRDVLIRLSPIPVSMPGCTTNARARGLCFKQGGLRPVDRHGARLHHQRCCGARMSHCSTLPGGHVHHHCCLPFAFLAPALYNNYKIIKSESAGPSL